MFTFVVYKYTKKINFMLDAKRTLVVFFAAKSLVFSISRLISRLLLKVRLIAACKQQLPLVVVIIAVAFYCYGYLCSFLFD